MAGTKRTFLVWLSSLLFLPTNCLDFWYHHSGSFYLNFYVWDRTQEYLNQSGVSRADLDTMAGVSIFRDGLRVLPYGEAGNDWLDLDRERINNPSERIGNQQIIGFVEVFQLDTPGLRDKTNREGLIDNNAFRDLRALVRATINVFTSQWLQDRPKPKKTQRVSQNLTSKDVLHKATTIAEVVAETARDDIVVPIESASIQRSNQSSVTPQPSIPSIASIKQDVPTIAKIPPSEKSDVSPAYLTQRQAMHHLVEYLQEAIIYQNQNEAETEQRFQVLMHLASTGMAAERVVHEFGRQINAAIAALRTLRNLSSDNSDVAQAIRTLDTSIGTLRNEFRVLAPYESGWRLQRTELISVREAVALAIKLNEHLIDSAAITIGIEGDDFDVAARPASLVQIVDNLIHNACSWLESWQGARCINIVLNKKAGTITITDTGPGVPQHMQEAVFKPFVTLRNGGRGLGLYITLELLNAMHGSITLDQQKDIRGASFTLHFPKSDK